MLLYALTILFQLLAPATVLARPADSGAAPAAASPAPAPPASAPPSPPCSTCKIGTPDALQLPNISLFPNGSGTSLPEIVISTLTYIAGILGVIFLVIAAIQYATSNGNSSRIDSAKNTIRMAVIGLIVAILSQAIVVFVIQKGPH